MEILTNDTIDIQRIFESVNFDIPTHGSLEGIPETLQKRVTDFRDIVAATGNDSFEALDSMPVGDPAEALSLFFHFQFADRAKQLLLLCRDVLFQHLKGKLLVADGKMQETQLEKHIVQSVGIIDNATLEFKEWSERETAALKSQAPSTTKNLKNWRLQTNPWPVFSEQMDAICEQCASLMENHQQAEAHRLVFKAIHALTFETLDQCSNEGARVSKISKDILDWLENATDETPGKIATKLEHTEDNLTLPNHLDIFTQKMEALTEALPSKWQITTSTEGGMLLRHDLDLKKRTAQWLEGEILPTLYKIWEQTEAMHNSAKMSLSNMRNRAVLLPSGNSEKFDAAILSHPLSQTIKSLQTIENELVALSENIKAKMTENFRLSNIYETSRPFLPLSLQHTVRQIEATRGWLFDQIAKWGSTRLALLHRLWYNLEKEENMGFSEKTARFIEHRQPDPANHHYTSIFLTKGFVGASFATGRQDQMSHFDNLVRQWEKGFRGAALLTGRRFCGKSFFGEWAATRHFPNNIIRLAARQETNFKGRKCPGTTNLAEVLDFVKKYALHDRPLLWLDDLELWQDAEHSLFDNTAALLHFNDHHATRCFVMASINRWSHQHLQALLDIDRGFQATLKFDTMPVQNIAKAILIRHGATHKKLVSKDGIELFPGQVQRLVRRVEKAAHGNIGEALQSWAAAVHIADDDSVTIDFQDKYSLPSNFSPDMVLLLTEVLTQKRTDEYHLRKQFGQSFNDRYADIVRRLLGTGLLNRLPDGSLEINENIVNALAGRLLKNG